MTTTPLTAATAAQLRAIMARKRVKVDELAGLLGVSDMWVTRRRQGFVSMNFDDVSRLAAALQVPVAELTEPATKLTEVA